MPERLARPLRDVQNAVAWSAVKVLPPREIFGAAHRLASLTSFFARRPPAALDPTKHPFALRSWLDACKRHSRSPLQAPVVVRHETQILKHFSASGRLVVCGLHFVANYYGLYSLNLLCGPAHIIVRKRGFELPSAGEPATLLQPSPHVLLRAARLLERRGGVLVGALDDPERDPHLRPRCLAVSAHLFALCHRTQTPLVLIQGEHGTPEGLVLNTAIGPPLELPREAFITQSKALAENFFAPAELRWMNRAPRPRPKRPRPAVEPASSAVRA